MSGRTCVFSPFLRILCETVKDFVAKVGKAYEKSTENAEECDSMSLKVSLKNNAVNIHYLLVLKANSIYIKFLLIHCPVNAAAALHLVLKCLFLCALQCAILNEKLDSLLQTLNTECQALPPLPLSTPPIVEEEQEEEEEEEEEASEESLTELKEKLEEEETEKGVAGGSPHQLFKSREQLMLRADSLKKAVRQVIEQAERGTCSELQDKDKDSAS